MPLYLRLRQYGLEASPLKSRRCTARASRRAWASAWPGGSGHALHAHVVNQTPEGKPVNPATCDLRILTNHAPLEACQELRDTLQVYIYVQGS